MKFAIDNTTLLTPVPRYEIHIKFLENRDGGSIFIRKTSFLLNSKGLIESLRSTIIALRIICSIDVYDPIDYHYYIEYLAFFSDVDTSETFKLNPGRIALEHALVIDFGCFIESYKVYYFDQYERRFEVLIKFSEEEKFHIERRLLEIKNEN